MEKKKRNLILGLVLVLLLLVVGVTYAFFTYESGTKSDIVTGQIYMNYEETSTISLTGVFPETKAQALSRNDENGVFEFTITGRNTSKYPVYYEIDLLDGGVMTGKTEQSTKILPEHVMIYLEKDGVPVIEGKTYADWNNKPIYVETVPAGTTSNIEHKYTLRMWIDENVTISDTDPNADYTTSEWNDAYTSLKIRVVGDFEEKEVATDASCFTYNIIEPYLTRDYVTSINLDTNEEKVEACMANMLNDGPEQGNDLSTEQDGYQSFCQGNGTVKVEEDSVFTLKDDVTYLYYGGATLEEIQNIYPVVSDIKTELEYYILDTSDVGIASCVAFFESEWGPSDHQGFYNGETYEKICDGTGTMWGGTFVEWYNDGGFEWHDRFVENNVLNYIEHPQCIEITNYDETCGTDVIIPSTIEGLPVTRIADASRNSSPFGDKGITSVNFPNTLKYIGDNSFDISGLTEVIIPESVVSIGRYAFAGNPLVNVNIKGNPVLGNSSFVPSNQYEFQTFRYGGTCAELNQYTYVLQTSGYEPQDIITSDTNNCVYNSYSDPK